MYEGKDGGRWIIRRIRAKLLFWVVETTKPEGRQGYHVLLRPGIDEAEIQKDLIIIGWGGGAVPTRKLSIRGESCSQCVEIQYLGMRWGELVTHY